MAKPNFSFQKRQREQEREKKKKEKLARKQQRASESAGTDPDSLPAPEHEALDDAPPGTPA